MTHWQAVVAILGMAAVTVVARGFFLIPERELPLPSWVLKGLRYAPLAALVAVIAPEIALRGDGLVTTWRDPRLFAALVGTAFFVWQRSILATIAAGTAVLLALKIGLGW